MALTNMARSSLVVPWYDLKPSLTSLGLLRVAVVGGGAGVLVVAGGACGVSSKGFSIFSSSRGMDPVDLEDIDGDEYSGAYGLGLSFGDVVFFGVGLGVMVERCCSSIPRVFLLLL